MRFLTVFVKNDLKNISRDALLLFVLTVPWLIPVFFRLAIPPLTMWLEKSYGFNLQPYYPLLLSFAVLLQVPLIFGIVFGFLLLDEKDDGILAAIQVTPLSMDGYLKHRLFLTFLLSVFYVIVMLMATGLVYPVLIANLFPIILLAGLLGIGGALFIAVLANNKVEGLALMKAMGMLLLGPLAAFFIEGRWQLLLGFVPSYWLAKAYGLVSAGENALLYILAGLAYLSLLIYLLLKKFRRKYAV